MDVQNTIPEKHQEFCKAVARLCREHGLRSFGGQFTPGFGDPWRSQIVFSWAQGRHGEDAGRISITSTLDVRASIDGDAESEG